jgi:chromosomal replication initiator protein
MNDWQPIAQKLAFQVNAQDFRNWLEPVRFSELEQDGTLHLLVPNSSASQWLEQEYRSLILETAVDLGLPVRSVLFEVDEGPRSASVRPQAVTGKRRAVSPVQKNIDFTNLSGRFNPDYTFDRFVVGSCNEFAHAAAQAVASNPARSYNPLYIYGGVGMGKTHLMHAVAHQLHRNFPDLRIIYTSSEEFMNEMISSLRYDKMTSFHHHFRSADCLLIDDIQVLGKRERTQEELFHTFNALHNSQKQIVISSDSSPQHVPGLVSRLRSRFQWGLTADIQPPDLETKMAILDRKAEEVRAHLPEEVRVYLARRMKSNIRELEGTLIRLVATASLSGAPITISAAQQALQSIGLGEERQATFEGILKAVADEFGLRPPQLREKSNARVISFPRQIAMYLTKELLGSSLPEIGKLFGGKHHTTALHAISKIEGLRQTDPAIDRLVHKLTDTFN